MKNATQPAAAGPGTQWGPDIAAGVVVTLVALPLCLGIALASGAPLVSGLITGVLGGLIVSWMGGTALLVSGPAAGLAAIVAAAVMELNTFEAFLTALVIAGAMQLGFGLARAGKLISIVPSSVITGMLAAIGVLLILQQSPYALGTKPAGGAHGFGMLMLPVEAVRNAAPGATIVAVSCLIFLFSWDRFVPKLWAQRIPGPLVAVILGTVIAAVLGAAGGFALAADTFVTMPDVMGDPRSAFHLPDLSVFASYAVWKVAITLAVVASLETLLSMEATDRLDPWKRKSDGNRELVGQGAGNLVAGLIGGLPMTGVIVRSSANIAAGGRTWRSAFVHGVLLLLAVVALPGVLAFIPLPALAAVLLHIGWKLAHPSRFIEGARIGVRYAIPLYGTVLAVIATDLLIGVGVGLALSGFVVALNAMRHGHSLSAVEGDDGLRVELGGATSFLHKPRLQSALGDVPDGGFVTVDGSRTRNFDHDVLEYLHGFKKDATERGIEVNLIEVPKPRAASGH